MRLVAVDHPRPGQRLQCGKCIAMYPAQDMMADLDGEPFKAYYCRTCVNKWDPYEIQPEDVGKVTLEAFGRKWGVADFLGRVMAQDVGKLVYRRGDVLQVENNEQRDARRARAEGR